MAVLLQEDRTNDTGLVILLLALATGIGLMVPFLTAGPLTLDEHCSYWLIKSDVPSTILERSLSEAAIPPLSAWLQWLLIQTGGRNELMLRMGSAFPFLLAIVAIYHLGKELNGEVTGGLSALLLACHPEAMDEVRIGRCYGLMILLSALSFWFTVRWLRNPRSWGHALGWALTGAALLWTHYLTAPILAMQLLVLVGIIRFEGTSVRPPMAQLGAAIGLVTLSGIPLIPSVIRLSEWNSAFGFGQQPTQLWELFGPIWIVGLGAGYMISRILSQTPQQTTDVEISLRTLGVLLFWGLAPLVFMAVVTQLGMPGLNNPRYRVAFAVPGACFLAVLLSRGRVPRAAFVGVVALLVCAWGLQGDSPLKPGRLSNIERYDWREIGRAIQQNGVAGQPVFVQSGLMESFLVPELFRDPLFMDYVACRVSKFYLPRPHPRYGLPFLWTERSPLIEHYQKLIKEHRDQSQAIWVACATDTDLCRRSVPAMHQLLIEAGYQSTSHYRYSTAQLVRYDLLDQ